MHITLIGKTLSLRSEPVLDGAYLADLIAEQLGTSGDHDGVRVEIKVETAKRPRPPKPADFLI